MKVLLQDVNTYEVRTIHHACMLEDIKVYRTSLEMMEHIFDFKNELMTGNMLPVGSVEFVRKAFNIIGVNEPIWTPYPHPLLDFLKRSISLQRLQFLLNLKHDYPKSLFIKPFIVKEFNGFIYTTNKPYTEYDEHDREQLDIIYKKDIDDLIWASSVVEFQSEYRYYIDNNNILGYARYDPNGLDDALEPDILVVNNIINTYNNSNPYSLDVGVLTTGETVLVEVNDAWSIGLYGKALTPKAYLNYLYRRWKTIITP